MMTRRQLLATIALLAANRDGGCGSTGRRRLTARPGRPTAVMQPGRHPLGLGTDRDGFVYVPASRTPDTATPLLLMLHGAGQRARISDAFQALADEFRVVLVAPDSRGATWDIVSGRVGPDVEFIDSVLAHAFARCLVDAGHLGVAGFSDGASYALWLGTANGDLFSHVVAFSPGFLAPGDARGRPRIFVSHGTRDQILPIDGTSRLLVPRLQEAGYQVTYREFDGPHTVLPATARQAFDWFVT